MGRKHLRLLPGYGRSIWHHQERKDRLWGPNFLTASPVSFLGCFSAFPAAGLGTPLSGACCQLPLPGSLPDLRISLLFHCYCFFSLPFSLSLGVYDFLKTPFVVVLVELRSEPNGDACVQAAVSARRRNSFSGPKSHSGIARNSVCYKVIERMWTLFLVRSCWRYVWSNHSCCD